jgi:lipopolysaccharide/colanic/teichoic acid biosynthesis glycosyltransferase
MKQKGWRFALKRTFDVLAAGTGLVIASPIIAAVSLTIAVTDGRPVFFRQDRPGKKGRVFSLVKFRTMRTQKSADVDPRFDAERITRVGRFIRNTSLDELPQLWNVFLGDMSLVGPRPLLVKYMSRYTAEQARRHEVLPGITGWTQVNGRNTLDWERKFALDVWYVDNWSPWLDAKILARTVVKVLRREDIAAEGHVTMPEFMGTESSPRAN